MSIEPRACLACAAAKRKCGKQSPTCLRCRERNFHCSYPPSRSDQQISFKLDDTNHGKSAESPLDETHHSMWLSEYASSSTSAVVPQHFQSVADFCTSGLLFGQQQPIVMWFNTVEAWEIDHFMPVDRFAPGVNDFKYLVASTCEWLTQWINSGSNSFIHPHLYRARFPRCIQDAYVTLSCYLSRTASNEKIVNRIIDDQARNLVQAFEKPSEETPGGGFCLEADSLDPLEHLARVQALLVYQVIGLYDGDIRLRYLAEENMPKLKHWTRQLAKCAQNVDCLGDFLCPNLSGSRISDAADAEIPPLWYSWILTESIHRTWLLVSGIHSMYEIVQRRQNVQCLGDMKFTARSGVWEADSANSWSTICSEMNVGMVHIAEIDKLLSIVPLEDLNDFAKVVYHVTLGTTKMRLLGLGTNS